MNEQIFEALQMLDAFASVGVKRFAVTQTNLQQEKINPYWPGVNVGGMRMLLMDAVPRAWASSQNVILRPHPSPSGAVAQLDDLDLPKLDRVRSSAFLTLETSPGNFQAWFFVAGADDEYVRQLVRRIQGVDWKASGAGRVAGSPNCKPKYAPDFPMVRVGQIQLKQQVELADFESLAPPPPVVPPAPPAIAEPIVRPRPRVWPSYPMCLERAPESASGGKQRGMADFTWCCTAADWGWSVEEIVRKLMDVSSKARENGIEYARKTAERASAKAALNPWKRR